LFKTSIIKAINATNLKKDVKEFKDTINSIPNDFGQFNDDAEFYKVMSKKQTKSKINVSKFS
jgi:hypothetical protein